MELDPILLARLQFAATICFHFIFPPITIGLAWLLVILETGSWKTGKEVYARAAAFFARLLALTFTLGVATGITMEFQFGTNWAEYSKFVGDIFGAPLAAEAVLAFFLESAFLGLYLFGRGRISAAAQCFSAFMVALGSTLSAFWILVANSWQQTPSGYVLQNGRAELTSFWEAVTSPSMLPRFFHSFTAAVITGAFFMAGVSAWLLIKNSKNEKARLTVTLALIVGFIAAAAELFPFGHWHAEQVAEHQPAKLASFEGLMEGQTRAPLLLFGIPVGDKIIGEVRAPGLLSLLVGGSLDTHVPGRNDFPPEDLPQLFLPFTAFHLMVGLGTFFIALTGWGVLQLWRRKLFEQRWFLYCLVLAAPLPVFTNQLGWIAAEVGRQPWIVYGVLRTSDAISRTVPGAHILFSLIMFTALYTLLLVAYLWFLARMVQKEAALFPAKEGD